jgi:PKD repeat protein
MVDFLADPEITCPIDPYDIQIPGPQEVCIVVDIMNSDSVHVGGYMGNPYWDDSVFCFNVIDEMTYYFEIRAFNDCGYDSCVIVVEVDFPTQIEACFRPDTAIIGPAPLEVCFTNCSVWDDTCCYYWYVDDSLVTYEFEPCITFTDPGCYDVSLVITNGYVWDTMYVADLVCVEETYPPMWISVYCAQPVLNDMPLVPGDLIEAFDPDEILCGSVLVKQDGSYGLLEILHDDLSTPEDDGAWEGDTISFQINGVEVANDPVIIWTQNGDYFELCSFSTADCRTLTLMPGWNWVSWNLAYSDDIGQFVADFSDCIYVVLSFDQRGLTYVPTLAEFSTLNAVDYYHGYMFKMTCSVDVEICGPPIDANDGIGINAGWNLVSYWPDEELPIETALASIYNYLLVVLGYNNGPLVWAPDYVDYNTLTSMAPLFGYWIKSSSSAMLAYPGFTPPTNPLKGGFAAEKMTPSQSWMSLYGAGIRLDGRSLASGAMIEVFTEDGVLCGSSITRNGLLKFTSVYGYDNIDDNTTSYPKIGDRLELFVDGRRVYPDITWDGHGTQYRVGDLLSSEEGVSMMPEGFALYQNYPNPFNPTTTIRFNLPEAGFVELSVFNLLGQKIRTVINEHYSSGEHLTTWDGLNDEGRLAASGIYFYRLKVGDLVLTKKMNLMK